MMLVQFVGLHYVLIHKKPFLYHNDEALMLSSDTKTNCLCEKEEPARHYTEPLPFNMDWKL